MRRIWVPLLSSVFVLAAGQAHAAHWTWTPVSGGAVAYDDLSRYIDIRTGIVGVNTVTYYRQVQHGAQVPYSFLVERLEFECRGNLYRWSNSSAFDASGQQVSAREDGEWTQMGAELGSVALYRHVLCSADPPPDAETVSDLDALFKAMTAPPGSRPPATASAPAAPPAAAPSPPRPSPAAAAVATPPKPASPPAAARAEPAKIQPKPLDLDALAASLASPPSPQPTSTPPPALRP